MIMESQSTTNVVLQIAISAAFVHILLMKIPQQADSALNIIWSSLVACPGVLIFLCWRQVSVPEGFYFLALFAAIFYPLVVTLQVIYNVYFRHRGIPGSFWYMATDLVYAFSIVTRNGRFRTKGFRKLQKLHAELGAVIRIQPNHISFNTVAAIEDIHGARAKTRKREPYAFLFGSKNEVPNVFSTTDKTRHDYLRRVLQPSFVTSSLDLLSPTVEDFVKRVIRGLEKEGEENNGIVEISNWVYNFTFSVIGALALGTDFNGLETREPHEYVKYSFKYLRDIDMWMFITWAKKLKSYLPLNTRVFREAQKKMESFIRECINAEIDNCDKTGRKTLLLSMKNAIDPKTGEPLSRRDLVANAFILLGTGSSTTGHTLVHLLKLLLTHPRTWSKLCDQVRQTFNSIDEINIVEVRKLWYLDMVLSEGMRCGASLPFGSPRLTPPEGAIIAGVPVAGDTYVSTPHFVLHRNKEYFSNPECFIPERWGEDSNETYTRKASLWWGHGPHECLGKGLAIMELKMLLVAIVLHFDVEWVDQCQDPIENLWSRVDPVHLKLYPRGS